MNSLRFILSALMTTPRTNAYRAGRAEYRRSSYGRCQSPFRCCKSSLMKQLGLRGGGVASVEDDGEGGDMFGFDVAIDEEALAFFGDVVGEDVGAGDGSAAVNQ